MNKRKCFNLIIVIAIFMSMMSSSLAIYAQDDPPPAGQPTGEATEQPAEATVTEEPTEEPPAEQPATPPPTEENPIEETSAEESTETPTTEVLSAGEPVEEPTETPTAEITEEPIAEPAEEPAAEPTAEITEEPTEDVVTEEPIAEPTSEVTEEPVAEPTDEPTEEVTEEPIAEPTDELTEEPTAEVTEEPTPEVTEEPAPLPSVHMLIDPATGFANVTQFSFTNATEGCNVVEWIIDGQSHTEAAPSLIFDHEGSIGVTLRVDCDGQVASAEGSVLVEPAPAPLSVGLSAAPTSGPTPLTVVFTPEITGDNPICQLETGDGGFYDTCDPVTHTYGDTGAFQARLTVQADGGQQRSVGVIVAPYAEVAPPVAAFHWELGAEGWLYLYNDSTGSFDQVTWTLSTSDTSTELAPAFQLSAGTHTITLAVAGAGGDSSITKSVTILPTNETQAGFDLWPESCTAPCTVNVRLAVTGEVRNTIYEWGDGTSTENAPEHARHEYTTPGVYPIVQTLDTPAGTVTATREVTIKAPVFGVRCEAPDGTLFEAPADVPLRARVVNGTPAQVDWDFGDTQSGSGLEVTHRYDFPGTYYANVTVTDDTGQIVSDYCEINIVEQPDAVVWFWPSPDSGPPTLRVSVMLRYLGQIDPSTSVIEWGDGASSTGLSPAPHDYTQPGRYTITWTVTDGSGAVHTRQRTVNVYAPVEAVIQANKTTCEAPCALGLDASGSRNANRFRWEISDGRWAWGKTFNTNLMQPGTYTVTLQAFGAGGSDVSTLDIVVKEPTEVGISITSVQPFGGFAPLAVCMEAATTGSVTQLRWDGGNGSSGSDARFCTTYDDPGVYAPRVTAIGPLGSQSASAVIHVLDGALPPVQIGQRPGPTDFAVCFSTDAAGATSITWLFPDGSTSNEASPCYDFGAPGRYQVLVEVEEDGLLSVGDYMVLIEAVTNDPPAEDPPAEAAAPAAESDPTEHAETSAEDALGYGSAEDVGAGELYGLGSVPVPRGTLYTVKPGDYLIKIAREQCGDGNVWRTIYDDNRSVIGGNPNLIYANQQLVINCPNAPVPSPPSPDPAPGDNLYTVKPGDYLMKIAREQCGDANAWPKIYEDNKSVIGGNPNLIYPGQQLVIKCPNGQTAPQNPPSPVVIPNPPPPGPCAPWTEYVKKLESALDAAKRNRDAYANGEYAAARRCVEQARDEIDSLTKQIRQLENLREQLKGDLLRLNLQVLAARARALLQDGVVRVLEPIKWLFPEKYEEARYYQRLFWQDYYQKRDALNRANRLYFEELPRRISEAKAARTRAYGRLAACNLRWVVARQVKASLDAKVRDIEKRLQSAKAEQKKYCQFNGNEPITAFPMPVDTNPNPRLSSCVNTYGDGVTWAGCCAAYAYAFRKGLVPATGGSAYMWKYNSNVSNIRYTLTSQEANGDLRASRLRPGHIVVYDRGQFGVNATHGHAAVIIEVHPDHVVIYENGPNRRTIPRSQLAQLVFLGH